MSLRDVLARREPIPAWLVFLGLGVVLFFLTPDESTNPHNGPIVVARGILRGEFHLPDGLGWMEGFTFNGRRYLAYPPMTTFILVPYAAIAGPALGQSIANSLLILGSSMLLYALLRRTEGLERYATIGAVAWVLGTPLLYSSHFGNVWLLMHSEGNFFLLLAIFLAYTQRRFFWAGVAFMIAGQTRYAILFAAPTFALLAVFEQPRERGWQGMLRDLIAFGIGASIPAGVVLLYQEWMFSKPLLNPYSTAWAEWKGKPVDDPMRAFKLEHVWKNLVFYATAHPQALEKFPFLRFDGGGQSAWLLSPFLLGMFYANLRIRLVRYLIVGALLMFGFYLQYGWQGYVQFGSRYVTDIFPLLVPIALSGFTRPEPEWPRFLALLVVISILFNAYGTFVVSYYGF